MVQMLGVKKSDLMASFLIAFAVAGFVLMQGGATTLAAETSGEIHTVVLEGTTSKGNTLNITFNSSYTAASVPRYSTINKLTMYANISGDVLPSYAAVNDYLYGNVTLSKDGVVLRQSSLGFYGTYVEADNVWMINATCYLYQTLSSEGSYNVEIEIYYLL